MTLKEKLQQEKIYINPYDFKLTKESVENFEKIAEEFAIGFFEWCVSQEALDLINDLVLVGEINKATTSKELLEIFKKEQFKNK